MSTNTIIEQIKTMTVVELISLKDGLMEIFGIDSSMLSGPAPAAAASSSNDAKTEVEQTAFSIVLTDCGAAKIAVIKAIREVTGLGLKEAKDIADNPGSVILKDLNKTTCDSHMEKLQAAGAKCEVK